MAIRVLPGRVDQFNRLGFLPVLPGDTVCPFCPGVCQCEESSDANSSSRLPPASRPSEVVPAIRTSEEEENEDVHNTPRHPARGYLEELGIVG